jgi:hypothetical protein
MPVVETGVNAANDKKLAPKLRNLIMWIPNVPAKYAFRAQFHNMTEVSEAVVLVRTFESAVVTTFTTCCNIICV